MSSYNDENFDVYSRSSGHATDRYSLYQSPDNLNAIYDLSGIEHEALIRKFKDLLFKRIHGLSFSPYMDGQSPGSPITSDQIRQRLDLIKPYTKWIRTFSCTDGNEKIPAIAHDSGLKTMVGVGIGHDKEKNEQELATGIELAKQGFVDILAVGNEVLLRNDIGEDQLLEYIRRAKDEVPEITVAYVDAYFLFEKHPRITNACDVLLINCYPFWERCPAQYALVYMKEMYRRAVAVANGKKVIISETGWPDKGSPYGGAEPGYDNALKYFINTYQWANQEGIEIFYFSSFDEAWKVGDEGDVGAYWGLWDKDGKLKYS